MYTIFTFPEKCSIEIDIDTGKAAIQGFGQLNNIFVSTPNTILSSYFKKNSVVFFFFFLIKKKKKKNKKNIYKKKK